MSRKVCVELHWYIEIPEDGDFEAHVATVMKQRNMQPLGRVLPEMVVYAVTPVQPWEDPLGGMPFGQ